jgi:hypothetical protein
MLVLHFVLAGFSRASLLTIKAVLAGLVFAGT